MIFSVKRQKRKNILFCLMTVGLICILLNFLNCLLMRDNSRYSYSEFLASDTEYDVLFFGSSHVYSAISPMQLWKDYGITSYNLGCGGGQYTRILLDDEKCISVSQAQGGCVGCFLCGK